MQHWAHDQKLHADRLSVETVILDETGGIAQCRQTPLADLLRSLAVTLPVDRVIRADRPGAI